MCSTKRKTLLAVLLVVAVALTVWRVPGDPDGPLDKFLWLKDEHSFLASATNPHSWNHTQHLSQRLAAIDGHIAWLRNRYNLRQLPEDLRPYAQELAEMYEVLQLIIRLRRNEELPPLRRELMDKLLFSLDYQTLSELPWPQLETSFPDLPAVQFYSQLFDGSYTPSAPVLAVVETKQIIMDLGSGQFYWSADGQWLALQRYQTSTMLFHPETNSSLRVYGRFVDWAPTGNAFLLRDGRHYRIFQEPMGAEHVITVSIPSFQGEVTLQGDNGELTIAKDDAYRLRFYTKDTLIVQGDAQGIVTDFGLANTWALANEQYTSWRLAQEGHGFRLHATPRGREVRDPAGNYLGMLHFPGDIEIAGSSEGWPVIFSGGSWNPRVWVREAEEFKEYPLPAHLKPVKWLGDHRILCALRTNELWSEPMFALLGGPPRHPVQYSESYVVYTLTTAQIQGTELHPVVVYGSSAEYMAWWEDNTIYFGRVRGTGVLTQGRYKH